MSLRRQCLGVFALTLALVAARLPAQQSPANATEIDNVAAFARLYGVARWFYPSDAAAALDWNRFAVEGVRRVRSARTSAELETTLKDLFTPLGPGIEIGATLSPAPRVGARNADLIAWNYRGAGISEGVPGPYSAKRVNRSVSASASRQSQQTMAVLMQAIPADTLRGRSIRLRGQMRITNPSATGWSGMWLRVDRPGQTLGFFDNMQNRPVRDTAWREYVIEGTIASDATEIVFGALSVESMSVDVDAMELSVRVADGPWTPLSIPDAGFEASVSGSLRGWSQNPASAFSRPAIGAAQGERFARIAWAAPGITAVNRPLDSIETPITGAVADFPLARGVHARVPLSLTDAEARTQTAALSALISSLSKLAATAGRDDDDARLADVTVAWSVFRHFYPYWGDIDVNWDARLRPQLAAALMSTATRDGHFDAVRMVVAELNDGHGNARDVMSTRAYAMLPVQFRILKDKLVITASNSESVPVGTVVTAIDGVPASERVHKETQLASGTPQWKQARAEGALQLCNLSAAVTLSIEPPTPGAVRDVSLPCNRSVPRPLEKRPESITELQAGIWYVDLTRTNAAQLRPMLDTIAKASAVVFDMRGYPTDAGAMILPHLMRAAEDSVDRWMHIARFVRPFGDVAEWQDLSWHLRAATPHIAGQRIFLTDARAISYAESVMGYVRDYKLGTIIGGTTAGANGNVAGFSVPGGFSISFTGMRVTRHDGRTAYHTSGVSPDIPLEPTLAGIRAGRDELLARALDALKIRP